MKPQHANATHTYTDILGYEKTTYDIARTIVGKSLNNASVFEYAHTRISAKMFEQTAGGGTPLAQIWAYMSEISESGETPNIVSVWKLHTAKTGENIIAQLSELTEMDFTLPSSIDPLIDAFVSGWQRYELQSAGLRLLAEANDLTVPVADAILRVQTRAANLAQQDFTVIDATLDLTIGQVCESVLKQKNDFVLLGYQSIDSQIELVSGEVLVLAGRPSMGKTLVGFDIAYRISKTKTAGGEKRPVLFFSLEMTKQSLAQRIVSGYTEIPIRAFRRGELSPQDRVNVQAVTSRIEKSDMFIVDDCSTLTKILEKIRNFSKKYCKETTGVVVIDYLQIIDIEGSYNTRDVQIGAATRQLKAAALKLNLIIIELAQLGRSAEKHGGDKLPQLSDLRESGAIEQDADVVAYVHRPEYYNITNYENGDSTRGDIHLGCLKGRNTGIFETVILSREIDAVTNKIINPLRFYDPSEVIHEEPF